MSYVKILDVNDHFLKSAANEDFMNDLKHEVETKLENVDTERSPYGKPDVMQLIISIEKYKLRFLQGEISATQLYSETAAKLDQFKVEHPGFNFLKDSVVNAYYS